MFQSKLIREPVTLITNGKNAFVILIVWGGSIWSDIVSIQTPFRPLSFDFDQLGIIDV